VKKRGRVPCNLFPPPGRGTGKEKVSWERDGRATVSFSR